MSHPLYSDYPEICSIHKCEMDGEHCPECEADEFVEEVLADVKRDLDQGEQNSETQADKVRWEYEQGFDDPALGRRELD